MTTSISSLFQAGLFYKNYFVVSNLKHLTPKTPSLEISKIWCTIKVFKSRLKTAKTRFKLSAGLNLETFDAILNETNHN